MKLYGSAFWTKYEGVIIQVAGWPMRRYVGYTERQAKTLYRECFGLKGKHIKWI